MPVAHSIDYYRRQRAENQRLQKLETDRKAAADQSATAARTASITESLRRIQSPTLSERFEDAMNAALPKIQQAALSAIKDRPVQQSDQPKTEFKLPENWRSLPPSEQVMLGMQQERHEAAQRSKPEGEFTLPANWRELPTSEQIMLGLQQERHNAGR